MNINATIRQIARQELAPLQLKVWEAYHVYGVDSFREIARQLDLSRTTVTDAYDGACKNLRQFGVRVTPDGTHYQEPNTWPDSPAPTADNSKPPTKPTSTEPAETTNTTKTPSSATPSPNPETHAAYAASPPSAEA